jgi:hypothetical protein
MSICEKIFFEKISVKGFLNKNRERSYKNICKTIFFEKLDWKFLIRKERKK